MNELAMIIIVLALLAGSIYNTVRYARGSVPGWVPILGYGATVVIGLLFLLGYIWLG